MDELNSSVVEQEVAAPAQEAEDTTEQEDTEVSEQPDGQEEGQEQPESLTENKRREIARHRAEKNVEDRIQHEVQAALAQRDAEFARRFAGVVNPITGQPIQNQNDYFAALDAKRKLAIQQRITQSGRVEPNDIEALINMRVNDAMAVKEAEMQARMEHERKMAEGKRLLDEQISELNKLDPSIKSFEDLFTMKNFPEFNALVQKGYDLVGAYKTLNYDEAKSSAAKAATQAAINSARGKSHLAPVGGGKADDSGLTDSDMEEWKHFGFSAKEAREYYKKLK